LTCPTNEPLELILEDGIESVECAITPSSTSAVTQDHLTPTSVSSIIIKETRRNNTVIDQQSITGIFFSGDSFRYVSSTATSPTATKDIPKVLQFDFTGQNVFGEPIAAIFLIEFTNDCTSYPIIQPGHFGGWIRFVSIQ
jgi:hypothetical protein